MVLINLDSYQILTLTAILVPSLVAIWVIFLQRDLTEKIIVFKKQLKEYEKKKAEELLDEIQDSTMDRSEDSLEIILGYLSEWELKREAIHKLLSNENEIYKIGRNIIILLAVVFISGMYSSALPNTSFFGIEGISRIEASRGFFILEILLILFWFWKIFNFAFLINKVQSGETKELEELIQTTIEKELE